MKINFKPLHCSVIVTGGVDVINRKDEISNLLKTTKIAGFGIARLAEKDPAVISKNKY
jgi:hypothetical protein